MITIESERLAAFILEPEAVAKNTQRFDGAGLVFQVLLDGYIPFCSAEPKNLWHPCTGGAGLCCEYSADYSALAKPGERFPKIGAGLLRREDSSEHIFYKRYNDFEPFPVKVEKAKDSATFVTKEIPCCGIAVQQKKTVRVEGASLTMEVHLKNVGEREVETREYCHNFFSIDGMASSEDYVLELPYLRDLGNDVLLNCENKKGCFKGCGRALMFKGFSGEASLNNYAKDFFENKNAPYTFKLSQKAAKASVTGIDDFVPDQISVWGVDHILSPEIMHDIKLLPGQEISWSRKWIFEGSKC